LCNSTSNGNDSAHFKCASGFYIDLLITISHRLKFTYDLYQVEDKSWGGIKNGQWNGLMKDLLTKKADLVFTSIKMTTQRLEYIDFSIPLMETGIAILVSLKPGSISATAFLSIFIVLLLF
jgi:glutamate receptor ionotropic, NMDA 2B